MILAKTVKGYGMGEAGEGQNITHQQKKMAEHALLAFRDRFGLPLTDEQLNEMPFLRSAEDARRWRTCASAAPRSAARCRRRRTGRASRWRCPSCRRFEWPARGHAEGREISTTMAFVRMLNTLLRDKAIGKHVVPIVPDESRTFGMEGMFRQLGIF